MDYDLIILMAGAGSRLSGLNMPKPLVELHNKPFFYWAAESISRQIPNLNKYFVYLREHDLDHDIVKKVSRFYPDSKFICIDKIQNGPVCTLEMALSELASTNSKIVIDCDQATGKSQLPKILENIEAIPDLTFISTIESNNPHHGFVLRNSNGKIVDIREKVIISNEALGGIYVFGKKVNIQQYIHDLKSIKKSELYLSDLLKIMLTEEEKILPFHTTKHLSFGTPSEYEYAMSINISDYLGWD
jgi:dTDP-glucose pyrophosphorylase